MADRSRRATSTRRPWYKRWWLTLLVIPAVLLAGIALLGFFVVSSQVPLPDDIAATTSVVLDVEEREVGGLTDEANREDLDFEEIPEVVREATMAAEDREFYDHRGISISGIGRALFTNVSAGEIEAGGSTITQQYIKNAALSPERTYTRKVREAALAIKLEQEYDKDAILEFYLNTVYYGRGASGIEAAARTYFGTGADELALNQAATLAGMLASPERTDPLDHQQRAERRRVYVLDGMREQGWIDAEEHERAIDAGLPEVSGREQVASGPQGYYLDQVRSSLEGLAGFDDSELYRGLEIHTAMDIDLQRTAQQQLQDAINEGPTDTGAVVTIDPETGGVRALVGGPSFRQQELNTAVSSPRQVGSTFKAFTLAAFLEAGFSPESRFEAPARIEIDGAQEPISNFGEQAFGEQTVRQATASSTNTVFVQMQQEVGTEQVIDTAFRAGMPREKSEEPVPVGQRDDGEVMNPFPGLTLGQDSFTPLELARGFATLAAEGTRSEPHFITRIETPEGEVLYEAEPERQEAIDLQAARGVSDLLQGVVQGGSGSAADIGRPVAGKTGTTSGSTDVWFAGYVPQLATVVWLGNLEGPIEGGATGGGLAAPLWAAVMSEMTQDLEVEDFTAPEYGDERVGEPVSCPQGYQFGEPPPAPTEGGTELDVLPDITDEAGNPCVEIPPEPEPEPESCPEGFAFAPPPDEDEGLEVIDDITDEDGNVCVEVAPEPDEDGADGEDSEDGDGSEGDGSEGDGSEDGGSGDDGGPEGDDTGDGGGSGGDGGPDDDDGGGSDDGGSDGGGSDGGGSDGDGGPADSAGSGDGDEDGSDGV